MGTRLSEKVAPKSTDLAGWREAIHAGWHHDYRSEELVAAIQDLGPGTDKAVLHPLAKDTSDRMVHMLRNLVDRHHPNEGRDIIEEALSELWTSLLQPNSPDGRGLREAFYPRVRFRVIDAIRRAERCGQRDAGEEPADDGCGVSQSSRGQPPPPLEETATDLPDVREQAVVAELAERAADLVGMISDGRKRLQAYARLTEVPDVPLLLHVRGVTHESSAFRR